MEHILTPYVEDAAMAKRHAPWCVFLSDGEADDRSHAITVSKDLHAKWPEFVMHTVRTPSQRTPSSSHRP